MAPDQQRLYELVRLMRGKFITLEGGEGVGKSTQARRLSQALEARGKEVLLTREPGGTSGAEAIRELLLSTTNDWSPRAESLLFAAARSDHVECAIEPALVSGKWVICDRFLDSSRAYQGGEGGLADAEIRELHTIGSGGLLPDLTILLQASSDEVRERLIARDGDTSDRIGGRSADYHRQVGERFRAFAASETDRFVIIDAIGSPEQVHQRVMHALAAMLRKS